MKVTACGGVAVAGLFCPSPCGIPSPSTFRHRAHTRDSTPAAHASSLEAGTGLFFQASFSGNFAFAVTKRNGNTQTFHFLFNCLTIRLNEMTGKRPRRQLQPTTIILLGPGPLPADGKAQGHCRTSNPRAAPHAPLLVNKVVHHTSALSCPFSA